MQYALLYLESAPERVPCSSSKAPESCAFIAARRCGEGVWRCGRLGWGQGADKMNKGEAGGARHAARGKERPTATRSDEWRRAEQDGGRTTSRRCGTREPPANWRRR